MSKVKRMNGDKILIDGPINLVRMEGIFNGINKVIYLFMDKHNPVSEQSSCDSANSINIADYLVNSFKNLDKSDIVYDFYLEIFPTLLINNDEIYTKKKQIYIDQVSKLFYENIKFDKNGIVSSHFKNVRLHYIDIRDVLYLFFINTIIFAVEALDEPAYVDVYKYIIETVITVMLDFSEKNINIIKNRDFQNVIKEKIVREYNYDTEYFLRNPDLQKEYEKVFIYLTNKLINSYHHNDVKKLVNMYVDIIVKEWQVFYDKLLSYYNNIKHYNSSDYLDPAFRDRVKKELRIFFFDHIFSIIAKFVDLYFIRRFLDKDYITNAIVYSGAAHSVAIIYILEKIGFEITHCANCQSNIDKLNEIVKGVKNFPSEGSIHELLRYFEIYGEPVQCTDISNFPKDFQ